MDVSPRPLSSSANGSPGRALTVPALAGKLAGGEKFVQRLETPRAKLETRQRERKMNSPRSEPQAQWTPRRPQSTRSGLSGSRLLR